MTRSALLASCIFVLATGCSRGGGGTGPPPPPTTPKPGALSPKTEPLTADEAMHFLARTGLGATRYQQIHLQVVGLDTYLHEALYVPPRVEVERAAERRFADPQRPKRDEIVQWWLDIMLHSDRPLREGLAFFWHGYFAVSQAKLALSGTHFYPQHVRLLRQHATGNFRTMLHEIVVDPAMLVWLDGVLSTKDAPNENFARELWELYTLGRDKGYTQADIEEAARAFTGWRLHTDPTSGRDVVDYVPARADTSAKTIFGVTDTFDYQGVVELTLAQRPVAEYVCRRLFQHYCHDDPPPEVIGELADMLRRGGYDLGPVLWTLLRSHVFFGEESRRGRIKAPVEYAIGFMRSTQLEIPMADLDLALLHMGQRPSVPPDVAGWRGGAYWLSLERLVPRNNFVIACLNAREHQKMLGWQAEWVAPLGEDRSAAAVVDALATTLGVRLSEAERYTCIDYLNTAASVHAGTGRVLRQPDPFSWQNANHVDERVRGLLFVLSQHPAYYVR